MIAENPLYFFILDGAIVYLPKLSADEDIVLVSIGICRHGPFLLLF